MRVTVNGVFVIRGRVTSPSRCTWDAKGERVSEGAVTTVPEAPFPGGTTQPLLQNHISSVTMKTLVY